MERKKVTRNLVLGVLFFLPVMFLIFLYPAKHNYQPLDIIKSHIYDIDTFKNFEGQQVTLNNHITVIGFLGNNPMQHLTEASNLKELVYDKFKGFKKFQIVVLFPENQKEQAKQLYEEISTYEDLRFFEFAFGDPSEIQTVFNSLNHQVALDTNYFTPQVFIVDKELNQRGRLDDRTDREIEMASEIYPLYSYNTLEVAEMKNKMSEDMRILFTEYRQKRKGDFDSTTRRANDLNIEHEQ
ncbi:hypothetical protein LRR18_00075 [Mangrovimonas sp. AS39]|uniref:hypothetical protein n=1 Tax=Mangrovimonas futianensis TaxID=2895523 RepID=UPI001E2EA9DE|nr:hypothetical protein [Mangrovimonas futianensis]MCF1189962.1 hypothetical protein [Mangrovimonas futianensis]MCF1194286.1 hypothetical protein [Mangrovimonas futianensis]